MIKSTNVFLSFNGNCRQALEFYQSSFGAQIIECTTYGEAEMAENDNQNDLIMNSNMLLGGMTISCTDNLENSIVSGNQSAFWLEIDSESNFDVIYSVFTKNNLTVLSPKEETFWNSVYAKVQDRFGVTWELNYQKD